MKRAAGLLAALLLAAMPAAAQWDELANGWSEIQTPAGVTVPVPVADGGTGADQSAIAKGGLLVGTAAGAIGIKVVGTNDQVLTADSTVAGGVKWAAASSISGLTTNTVTKATSATTIGNSSITDTGTAVSTKVPLSAPVVAVTTVRATQPAVLTITNATNATPIEVTAAAHGLVTGDNVSISGITGNTNANGYFRVTKTGANTFTLQNYSTGADIAGNGAYGGTPVGVSGIVQGGRVAAGAGTVSQPSYSTANDPDTGFSSLVSGSWQFSSDGAQGLTFSRGGIKFVGLGGTSSMSSVGTDTVQFGPVDAVTGAATQQRVRVQSRTGANADAPARFEALLGPRGTGSGAAGGWAFQTGYTGFPNTTSATAHTASDRVVASGTWRALTAGVATGFADVTVPVSGVTSGELLVLIEANDGTEYQGLRSKVGWSSASKATGNPTCAVQTIGTDLAANSSGSGITVAYTCTAAAGKFTIEADAASDLVETTLRANVQAISNGPGVTVTPL